MRDYANNRRTDLVTVSTDGKATGLEVPIASEHSPELTWVDDDRVAVGKGAGMFVVDYKQGTALAPAG